MNTDLKMDNLSHGVNRMRDLLLILLLIFANFSYSQDKKLEKFVTELDKRLAPIVANWEVKEVLLIKYFEFPKPESSVRLLDVGNYSFLELRYLDKNLSRHLYFMFDGTAKLTNQVHVDSTMILVSNEFRDQMLSYAKKIISIPVKSPTLLMVYDGPAYDFRICNPTDTLRRNFSYELCTDSINRQCEVFLNIIKDLRTKRFDEAKYLKLLKIL